MHTNGSHTNRPLHRGSFADGQAHPERDREERHVGTFADGEVSPETYPGEDEVGTFAEGQARPDEYRGEEQEGTFAEGAATVSLTPSIDLRCSRCGAGQTYKLVPDSVLSTHGITEQEMRR